MKSFIYFYLFIYIAVALISCNGNTQDKVLLSIDKDFKDFSLLKFKISKSRVRRSIKELVNDDKDSLVADYLTRNYYRTKKEYLWISKEGINPSSALLIDSIERLTSIGFSPNKFINKEIKKDIKKIQTLSIEEGESISKILARIEYSLTKALFRYAIGERFGYVTPSYILNRLDTAETKNGVKNYQRLYDIHTESVDTLFVNQLVASVTNDSLQSFFQKLKTNRSLFKNFQFLLRKTSTRTSKMKVLVNMERCRWRHNDYPELHKKYVLVNVPSFYLQAVDEDSVLSMRVACGALSTKTPLLNSTIERMDINPQWIIPLSIVKKQIISQLGNRHYFDSHSYFIRHVATGKEIDISEVTPDMLLSGAYKVVQRGGEGNALGRIVFRFPNNFSVYLHDTSSREAFSRFDRGVSHGCIRVEKPLELAVFLLQDKEEALIDKLIYSTTVDMKTNPRNNEKDCLENKIDRKRLINSKSLKPSVPLFITYYTLYPDEKGVMRDFPDVYGYDKVIARYLLNYID